MYWVIQSAAAKLVSMVIIYMEYEFAYVPILASATVVLLLICAGNGVPVVLNVLLQGLLQGVLAVFVLNVFNLHALFVTVLNMPASRHCTAAVG